MSRVEKRLEYKNSSDGDRPTEDGSGGGIGHETNMKPTDVRNEEGSGGGIVFSE